MKKGTAGRILAYVLTLCMIIGSITWPDITAKAETITLDLKPDTSWQTMTAKNDGHGDYGKAEIRISSSAGLTSMKAIADAGYKTLKIIYAVDTFTVASGQNAGVMPFVSYGKEWTNNDKWINLSKAGQFEAILDLSSISTTDTNNVGFGIQAANLQVNSTIKFRIVSAVLSGIKNTSGGSTGGSDDGGSGSTDLDSVGSTSSSVTASLADGNGTSKGDGYYETEITINNKSNSYIADWIAVADVSGSVTAVKDYSSWSDLKGVFSDGKLYIYPNTSKKSGAVNAGLSVSYSKLGYTGTANGVSITGVKVYYSSQSGAFDSFISSLSSTSGGAGDNTGEINTDIEYNYAKLLQESLYFFDANMCGSDVSAKSEFSWRSNCHTEDATATYNGKTVDVSGGYHDAGDHAKFGLPQAYTATVLGVAHMEFASAFAYTATEAHYRRIMDRFADYFERCTVLGSDGSVQAFCYQVGDGNIDHGYWGAPEKQSSRSGQATFTSDSATCTDIVSETAAALAAYYLNYKDAKALTYAEKLFAYADTKTKMTSAGPAYNFYKSGSWDDDYALAAALLYKATGKSTYADKYNRVYGNKSNPNWGLCWNNVDPLALLYSPQFKGKSAFVENQSGVISNFTKSYDNNYCLIDSWGSARYNAAHQMTGLMYDKINSKNDYSAWANGQMKYLLGNNAGSRCFVVGYNKYSVKHPHHRAASGYGDVASNQYTDLAHVITGALVGGPSDSSKNFDDNANLFQYTEVALDYNAGLVGAAAGLCLYVKNKGTDEEKAVQKVVPKSEVSSELRTISGAIEVVTPSSNPYLIDAGKLNDNIYVGTLVDDAGTPTVKVTQKDGVISVSFTQNKNYTITGTGEAVVFDTGNASGVTISDAAVKKITVRPGKNGLFIINVSGSSTVADGITCVKDSENTADVKIVGKDSSAGISSSKSGAATIKSEGNLEISGIQIRSEGKGIEADGTVKISGGSNRIDAVSSAISASDVEMTGGSMDAASTGLGENESVISADNSIKLVGGSITADASGSTGGNSFGVKSDDGTIIVDGDTVVGGDPTYSKDPVDSNGNPATEPTTKPTTKPTTEPTTKPTTNPEPTTKPTTKAESTTATTTKKPTTEKPTTAPSPQPSKDNKTVKVTKITLDKTSIILKVGESSQIRATVKPVNATNSGVIWSSSDISKVSVQSNGKISALGEGTATITVTARDGSGVTAKCKVTVTKKSSASNVSKPKQTDIRKTAKVTYRTLVNKKNRAIYTGKAIAPKLTVKVNGKALKAGRDYKVKYAANKNIGKAKVIITGAGKYKGTVVKYFRITTAKGKIYKVGSYRYKITNPALNGKGTVMLMSVSGKTTVRVPDIVKIGGKKFKVTSIRSGAFKNNKRIKKVIIGRNVSVIGSKTFYGCRNLKSVIIRSSRLSLKNVGKSAFTRTYAKCVIRVPASKVKQYKKILVKRGVSRTAVIKR